MTSTFDIRIGIYIDIGCGIDIDCFDIGCFDIYIDWLDIDIDCSDIDIGCLDIGFTS